MPAPAAAIPEARKVSRYSSFLIFQVRKNQVGTITALPPLWGFYSSQLKASIGTAARRFCFARPSKERSRLPKKTESPTILGMPNL